MKLFTDLIAPIHPEGYRFVAIFAAISFILFFIATPLGWLGVILSLWCAYFFRDPARTTPQREGLVISPADGVVNMICEAPAPAELGLGEEPMLRISVFMNVFDVHVNRAPVAGQVKNILYRAGQFISANLDKAAETNERQTFLIETNAGTQVIVVQIAGLVARRIMCFVHDEQYLSAGERFGLIRFGSRCDVYLPSNTKPQVAVGQRAIAGETILADFSHGEPIEEFNTD